MTCPICEQVPTISDQAGELLLAPALGHTFGRVKERLERDLGPERLHRYGGNVMSIAVADHGLGGMLRRLGEQLTSMEARDCPALFLEAGEVFDPGMLTRMEYAETLIGRAQSIWLADKTG